MAKTLDVNMRTRTVRLSGPWWHYLCEILNLASPRRLPFQRRVLLSFNPRHLEGEKETGSTDQFLSLRVIAMTKARKYHETTSISELLPGRWCPSFQLVVKDRRKKPPDILLWCSFSREQSARHCGMRVSFFPTIRATHSFPLLEIVLKTLTHPQMFGSFLPRIPLLSL